MAVATHTPIGFTGTTNEAGEALRFSLPTVRFRVRDAASWAVTSVTTSNLTVNIDPGAAECCGVYDTTTAASTLVLATNGGSTTRLDAIVARWTWGPGGGVTFAVLQGTSATVPPTPTRNPGVLYEAILAVVTVTPGLGSIPPGNVADIRLYGGVAGPLIVPQGNYYTYSDVPVGGEVAIGGPMGFRERQTANNFVDVPGLVTRVGQASLTVAGGLGGVGWTYPASMGGAFPTGTVVAHATPLIQAGLGVFLIKFDNIFATASQAAFRVYDTTGSALPNGTVVALGITAYGS